MTTTNGFMRNSGLKKGFETFAAWFPVGKTVRNIAPSDLDACLHNGVTHQYIMLEFKPRGAEMTKGQFRLLEDMTRASNQNGKQMFYPFVIWDEFSETLNLKKLPDDYVVHLTGIKPGMKFEDITQQQTTLGQWRKLMIKFCEDGFK